MFLLWASQKYPIDRCYAVRGFFRKHILLNLSANIHIFFASLLAFLMDNVYTEHV